MKEFTITGIPEGFEPIDKDINNSMREVEYLEYYFSCGHAVQWDSKHKSTNRYLILKKIKKQKEYRPFTLEEAKYRRDRWIRLKNSEACFKITSFDEKYIKTDYGGLTYEQALEVYVFEDTELPFGMEVIQ